MGALDTLYEPNAVFSQFLGSASMTFVLFLYFPAFLFCCFFPFLDRFLLFHFVSLFLSLFLFSN